MAKLKILYLQTFPLYGSGSGTYARYLARQIAKSHKVAMVCPDTRRQKGVKLYPITMPLKVAFTGHPEWPGCKLYQNLSNKEIFRVYQSFLRETIKAVEDFRPQIIHAHHLYPFSWAARFVKTTYFLPYIITCHGSEIPTVEKDKRYFGLTIDALNKAARIVPNSYWTREWMYNIFGDYKSNTRVIPGGVDITKFSPELPTGEVDKRFNLKGKKVVMFAGKLTRYKGVKYLIMAARKLDAEILILGEGAERKNLEERAKRYGLKNVHFAGHLGKSEFLNKCYCRADVFVAPSVWDEPLGLVILEAMGCNTPVVVTRKGGIPLAVKDGVNGFFVRPRNSAEIVEKVNKLLTNDKKREKMGERARNVVVERFSWEKIAHRFELIYEKFACKDGNGKKYRKHKI